MYTQFTEIPLQIRVMYVKMNLLLFSHYSLITEQTAFFPLQPMKYVWFCVFILLETRFLSIIYLIALVRDKYDFYANLSESKWFLCHKVQLSISINFIAEQIAMSSFSFYFCCFFSHFFAYLCVKTEMTCFNEKWK